MKKNIINYEALLISLASDGDCTAFHSLVVHYLSTDYSKSINEGMSHSEASKKACSTGANLFKSFIGAQPESFESWMKTKGEISDNSETEFLPSQKTDYNQVLFSNELHLHLQRLSSSMQHSIKARNGLSRFFTNFPMYGTISILASILIVSTLITLFISHSAIRLQLINKTAETTLLFLGKKQPVIAVSPDIKSTGVDSSTASRPLKDSTKIDTIVKVKVKPVSPRKSSFATGADNSISKNGSPSESGFYHSTEPSVAPAPETKADQSTLPSTSLKEQPAQNNFQQSTTILADTNSNRLY